MSLQDSFEENDDILNAMGHMAAINQRNRLIEQHKEQAEAIRKQTAELEKANHIEADRAKIERQRLAIEQKRMEADVFEREMRRQQAEQVRQLRNLMVDGMETLDSVKKSLAVPLVNETSKETALRKTAALQTQLKILESQSEILTDMSDMKELRLFRSCLSEFIAEQSAYRNLPENPLANINERLQSLKAFLVESEVKVNRLLGWKVDWLNQFPKLSLAELHQAQTELPQLKEELPSLQEHLRGMLNPLDWDTIEGQPDLHQELRICAELMTRKEIEDLGDSMGGIVLLGSEKSYRAYLPEPKKYTDMCEFAHSAGSLQHQVIDHLGKVDKRIDELIRLHDKHRALLVEAEAHLANENFRSAERVVKIYDNQRFHDIEYNNVDSLLERQLTVWQKFADLEDQVNAGNYKELNVKLRKSKETHIKAGSELATETSEIAQKVEQRIDNHHKSSRKSLILASIQIFLAIASIGLPITYIILEYRKLIKSEKEARARLISGLQSPQEGSIITVPLSGDAVMKFAYCPAGTFIMGGAANNQKVKVTLTKGFWLAITEVTEKQWLGVIKDDYTKYTARRPPAIGPIDWEDAKEFIKVANRSSLIPNGWEFSLPTEAQWEYACRAGGEQMLPESNLNLHAEAKKTNAWGFDNMNDDVLEWCLDFYQDELLGGVDPSGPIRDPGFDHVSRGNIHDRHNFQSDRSNNVFISIGFRPALVPSE